MKRVLFFSNCRIALMLIVGLSLAALAGPQPMWKVTFQKDIKWQRMAETGHLIVSTDEGLVGIEPENGSILWKMEDLDGLKEEAFDFIPFTTYAVINKGKGFLGTQNRMIVINILDGKEMWNSDALEIQSSMGQFILPEVNGLLVYGLDKKGKKRVFAADLETGQVIWQNDDFFKKRDPDMHQLTKTKQTLVGNQEPLFDGNETMITFMSKKSIQKWNARTGQLVWETEVKAKSSPALQYGYAPMQLNEAGDVLYTPVDRGVMAFGTKDGKPLWDKPEKLKGMVYQMQQTPQGLVVKGGPNMQGKDGDPFIQVLDYTSGQTIWKKEFKKLKEGTNFVVKDNRIYVYSDKKLFAIDISSGDYSEVADDLKFDGGEIPSSLSIRDGGFYLQSSNNLMLVGFDGVPVYHAYHKAPGSSLFSKIASTAAIMAVNTMSVANAYGQAHAEAMRYGHGEARYSLITRNPALSKRFKASQNAQNHVYILTNVETGDEKGPGLVKVNKDTGATDNQIVLGTKKPEYTVDEIEGRLFFQADDKEIDCYSL